MNDRSRYYAGILVVGSLIAGASAALAQNYPNKPIRFMSPATGGGADFLARIIAQALSANLGQQVIVDNRPNGPIPIEITARAAPDGYTLLFYGTTVWLMPFMRDYLSYDPVRDLAPVSLTNRSPNVLVVYPSLPAKSVKELIALARNKPGALNYATTGTGNATHISGELFKSMAGVDIVRINYKSTGTALNDVIAGQVQLIFATAASVTPHMKSGRLTALAVTSAQPSALFAGLPTVAASGVPGYEAVQMNGIFAPAKTPAAVVSRLNQEIVRALNQPETREKLLNTGVEPVGTSPQEFASKIKSEMTRLGKLIKDVGIRDE